ncbi:MAG TPA: hypothetical protein VHC00_03830 [Rhizobiaceae bacterium]|nr:hypothetical protein [Rhizobiaceae bacterium]
MSIVWPILVCLFFEHSTQEGFNFFFSKYSGSVGAAVRLGSNETAELKEEIAKLREILATQDKLIAAVWARAVGYEKPPQWDDKTGYVAANTWPLKEDFGVRPDWHINSVDEFVLERNYR